LGDISIKELDIAKKGKVEYNPSMQKENLNLVVLPLVLVAYEKVCIA
jgi:hypothetical protein